MRETSIRVNRVEELHKLRKLMGTLPEEQPKRDDEILIGVEGIKVKLIDYPVNPYKAMFAIATSTWSGKEKWGDKWKRTHPEGRIAVIKAVLSGQTLPQCLEASSFTFEIQGLSRSAFDQLARNRFSGIGSVGMRDNAWLDAGLRISSSMTKFKGEIEEWWKATKDLYQKLITEGKENWQNARTILPMGTCWRFTWTMNYRTLKDICSKRLCFGEQTDTCAVVWLMREEIKKKFPLLAEYLRPTCDIAKKCLYHKAYTLSEAFGVLFKSCGRNKSEADYDVATFNYACTSKEELEKQLKIKIPGPDEYSEELSEIDVKFFVEE